MSHRKKPSAAAMRAAIKMLEVRPFDTEQHAAIIDAEFAPVVEALRKLSNWPPSYPASENIERMRGYAASTLATLEAK